MGAAAAVTGPPRSTGPPAAVRSALKKGTDSGILIQVARHRAHFRPPPPARRQPASAATVRPAARAGGTGERARMMAQTGQKFSVAGHEVAAPAESTVGIEELRVGDGMR